MKPILSFAIIITALTANSQVFRCIMNDYQYFKYPETISLGEAMDSNLVVYDSLTYTTQTRFVFDLDNMILTYTLQTGKVEINEITKVFKSEPFIDVDVFIEGKGIYNYLFNENINGDVSMIVRERFEKNGMVSGFFTNKIDITH